MPPHSNANFAFGKGLTPSKIKNGKRYYALRLPRIGLIFYLTISISAIKVTAAEI